MATDPKRPRTTPEFFCGNDLLGTGSFGAVFKEQYRGRSVAVKRVFLVHLPEDEGESQREQAAMMKLNHLNVVKLFYVTDERDFR